MINKYLLIICILANLQSCKLMFAQSIIRSESVALNKNTDKSVNTVTKEKAQQWMNNQPVRFLENMGQMADTEGKPAPFVLFKTSAPGVEMYVTEKGLTYIFVKAEEEEREHTQLSLTSGQGVNDSKSREDMDVEWARINMDLKGARISKENIIKEIPSVTNYNYFPRNFPDGIYGVKEYEKITVKEVYPGIDWVLYNSDNKGFKYDFIVHPGADPKQIELVYSSLKPLELDRAGNLEIKTDIGTLIERAPISYQNENRISTHFVKILNQKNENGGYDTYIHFALGDYDNSEILTIDPKLVWATLYEGAYGVGYTGITTIDCDANGNLFASGYSFAYNLFLVNAGSYFNGVRKGFDILFILKFNSAGQLIWATYYGQGFPRFLKTDSNGNLFITGQTDSDNNLGLTYFPLQNPGGGAYFDNTNSGGIDDIFLLKFDNAGNRIWATYFGGTSGDIPYSMTIDNGNNVCIVGETSSSAATFPLKDPGGGAYFQSTVAGSFVAKFSNAGNLLWSTYLGGSGYTKAYGISSDNSGNIVVVGVVGFYNITPNFPLKNSGGYYNNVFNGGINGTDMFITKFNSSNNMLWSTYYGGTGDETPYSTIFDNTNNLIIAGNTTSINFPTQIFPGGYNDNSYNGGTNDVFILKFNTTDNLLWSTYLGGNDKDYGGAGNQVYTESDKLAVDNCNNVYYAFAPLSTNLPVVDPGCNSFFDNTYNGCPNANNYPGDQYIIRFSGNCILNWATYFGGCNMDFRSSLALDKNNNLYIAGEWINAPGGGGCGASVPAGCTSTSGSYPFLNPGGSAYFDNTFDGDGDAGFIAKFIPIQPEFTQSQINPGSCLCNGTATASITCGTAPYNFVWSNGSQTLNSNSNSNTASGLCPGNYSVKITDAGCATDTIFYTLAGGGGSLSLTSTQNNASCNASCNGSATVTTSGGSIPYTYSWSNGQTAQAATGLCKGTFSITVTDINNCKNISTVNITQPQPLVTGFSRQWSCPANTAKATITVNVANGTSPYTYLWSNSQTTQVITNITPGNYTVTVTDSKGCLQTETVSVGQPEALIVTSSSTNISCTTSGSASVSLVAGSTPVSYSWSTGQTGSGTSSVGSTLTGNIVAGGYTVTVTDGNGCTVAKTFNITGSSPVSAAFTQSPNGTVCAGTTVNFTNAGSTGTYTWTVFPGNVSGTTANFSYPFLTAGSYSISHVVSNAGCTATVWGNVSVINCSASPTATATGGSVCSGACITVTSSGTGGVNPYTYSWSTGSTSQNITPCPALTTTYTVTIKDTGGNTSTSAAVVTVNPVVTVSTMATNITCSGSTNGSSIANPGSGTSPYAYSWSNSQTTQTATGLTVGNYTVTITDAKSCTATSVAVIISPSPLTGQFTKGTAICAGCGCKEWIMVNATGGSSPYSYIWPGGYINRYKNQLCPGTYSINIKDKNGCSVNVNVAAP